ncbi:unnamed protein product [Parascedosporium putredinis]|uniref:Cytochrome b5 heme-binding domain-containing protein n=1 Tax=Parascedosporium putredinis TaxID=1442378 RepID=A0A9P1GWR6_9PEZI|nr:unnamed protein product [Parascedosporium putredinis]CAI7989801.1 unnamed protein product [Parascedosporium putredinis]
MYRGGRSVDRRILPDTRPNIAKPPVQVEGRRTVSGDGLPMSPGPFVSDTPAQATHSCRRSDRRFCCSLAAPFARPPALPRTMNRDKVLSPGAIDDLIADGQKIVIMDEYVLKLDGWLDRHPGGRLVILHMVGKDATDEIHA